MQVVLYTFSTPKMIHRPEIPISVFGSRPVLASQLSVFHYCGAEFRATPSTAVINLRLIARACLHSENRSRRRSVMSRHENSKITPIGIPTATMD